MKPGDRPVSLLWRVMLSTSIAITLLFGALGWVIQSQFARITDETMSDEVRASFQAYESLWRVRADELASISLVLSRMPDIRAAFGTHDRATIQDTAKEVWARVGQSGTLFAVSDPEGKVIAQAGQGNLTQFGFTRAAAAQFPNQARGFVTLDGSLYQIVLTPVYVASGEGTGLLNVLVVGEAVDSAHVAELKQATGGSDFLFTTGEQVAASTLPSPGTVPEGPEYFRASFPLTDIEGRQVGQLSILRSLEATRQRVEVVRGRLIALWGAAVIIGLTVTYWLTRRLLRPLGDLGRAAAEIGRGNYQVQLPVEGSAEIASLAASFNTMSTNLGKAREELIHQERISTIGRISTSIIHDLRNPLAAIYGGAEMLVDRELSAAQVQRLAGNIYRASRKVQDMLQELADVTQGRGHAREVCRLREVVQAACEPLLASAEERRVDVQVDIDSEIEIPLDRSPMERVFQNLVGNAIEAMSGGGKVSVVAKRGPEDIAVVVEDNGPGIPPEIAAALFQPFVTAGKKNGVGLGLALSRKTVLSHGGDLSLEPCAAGARFRVRLPL
ncbi:MAG: ATP-binding protein [Acidobacteriota bacterium]